MNHTVARPHLYSKVEKIFPGLYLSGCIFFQAACHSLPSLDVNLATVMLIKQILNECTLITAGGPGCGQRDPT